MRYLLATLLLFGITQNAVADEKTFTTGPVFDDYGPVASIDATMPIPPDTIFRHSFDVAAQAPAGEPNTTLVSAARFINLHARAGVPEENITVAVIVHGNAVKDVADENSASAGVVAALIDHGVRIIVCGQSATYRGITTDDLLPGVEMAHSAMTAHALFQQQGYTLNPF